jgi:uncharacterized protein YecE (DUF72 family)
VSPRDDQLALFAEPPVETVSAPGAHATAAALPSWVRLGTSTWTFPGWAGIVYGGKPSAAALARGGLRAYAKHPLLRTVGIDRSYYGPLTRADLEGYAAQLPAGFRAVSKVWEEITTFAFPAHPRFGARAGQQNPRYLDPDVTREEVLQPFADAFAAHAGPFVFELAPSIHRPEPLPFARAIDRLLGMIRRDFPAFQIAFEIRNRELLTPRYLSTLRAHGAAHVLSFWSQMPTLREQLALPGVLDAPFVVSRLMLPPGMRYEDQRAACAPFDRIVRAQPAMREDVVTLARECAALGPKDLWVLVNNKAEGSAPLTVFALAGAIAAALGRREGPEGPPRAPA